jgi:hypothetical protein
MLFKIPPIGLWRSDVWRTVNLYTNLMNTIGDLGGRVPELEEVEATVGMD